MKNLEQPGGCECIKLYLVGNKWLPRITCLKKYKFDACTKFSRNFHWGEGGNEFSRNVSLSFKKKEENSSNL